MSMPYPTRPKGRKLRLCQIEIFYSQTATQRNESDTDGQLTDSGQQTFTADNGLRARAKQEGPETEHITQQPTHIRSVQEQHHSSI